MRNLFFYQGLKLVTVFNESGVEKIFRGGRNAAAERGIDDPDSVGLYAVDVSQGLVSAKYDRRTFEATFSPFGFCYLNSGKWPLVMYAGERFDGCLQGYLLGGGYRLFRPLLMRFCSPDELSPFDAGGINSYAYCGNDPVNYHDPSGRTRGLNVDLALHKWLAKARMNIKRAAIENAVVEARARTRVMSGMRGGGEKVSAAMKGKIHQRAREIFSEQIKAVSGVKSRDMKAYFEANPDSGFAMDYNSRITARAAIAGGKMVEGNLGMVPVDAEMVVKAHGSKDVVFKSQLIRTYDMLITAMRRGDLEVAQMSIDEAFLRANQARPKKFIPILSG